jgi:hypothetical protein
MWSQVRQTLADVFRWSGTLSQSEWFLMLIAVVVVGFVCLRGYGSRTAY